MPVEMNPPMYGMKHRKNDSTNTGRASGMPSTTMITSWLNGADERDRGRADHVAAEHVEGAPARRLHLRGDLGTRVGEQSRPDRRAVPQQVEREQDAEHQDHRRRCPARSPSRPPS